MSLVPRVEFAELARLTEGDDDPTDVLQRIVEHAVTLVPGCTGAGLTVRTAEGEETVAITGPEVRRCHDLQFHELGEGPAREALRFGEPRRSDDLDHEPRWGDFPRQARSVGFASTLALPLLSDRFAATALNLYSDRPGVFGGATFDVALLFAAQGGAALDNAEVYRRSRELVDQLHRTLATRSIIERAKGLLMSRHSIGSEQAFELLREQSQRTHQKLRDVAESVVREHDPGAAGLEIRWTPPRRPTPGGGNVPAT